MGKSWSVLQLLVVDHSSVTVFFFNFISLFAPVSNNATIVEEKINWKIKTPGRKKLAKVRLLVLFLTIVRGGGGHT